MSDIEEALAYQLRVSGITSWEREVKFSETRKWRFDFAFLADRLAVEVEGGTWANGRHTRGSGYTADCEKYDEATLLGWRVLRFTSEQVENGYALDTIKRALGGQNE